MKKLRKGIAAFAITLALTFGSGAFVQVRADGGSNPAITICRQIEERCGMNGNIVRKLEKQAIRFPTAHCLY